MLAEQRQEWLVAGAIWGPGLFIIAWVSGGLVTSGYSPMANHISDLAAVGAPTRVLMTGGLAAYGIGVGTSAWPLRRLIGTPAAVALGLNAALTFGVLLTPLGRPPGNEFLHGAFAVAAYLSLSLVGPLAAAAWRRRRLTLSMVSLTVGLITMVSLWASLGDTTPGLFQRLGLTATDIWLMAIGYGVVVGRLRGTDVEGGGDWRRRQAV